MSKNLADKIILVITYFGIIILIELIVKCYNVLCSVRLVYDLSFSDIRPEIIMAMLIIILVFYTTCWLCIYDQYLNKSRE